MAELQDYGIESAINPDDQKLSQDHEAGRLDHATQFAKAEVNKLGISPGTEGFGQFFEGESDGWNLTIGGRRSEKLKKSVSKRVKKVLENTGASYEGTLTGSSSANVERIIWGRRKESVLDNILQTNKNTKSSLLVAEGYEKFLAEVKTKIKEEWGVEKQKFDEYTKAAWNWRDNTNPLRLILPNWASDRKRTEASVNKFEEKLEEMLGGFDDQIKRSKELGKTRRDAMQVRIESKINSSVEQANSERLWSQIKNAVDSNNLNFDVSEWGNFNEQEKIDFLEAIQNMDIVKNGISAIGQSKKNYYEQKDIIESSVAHEDMFRDNDNFDFQQLMGRSAFDNIPPAEESIPLKKLTKMIWDDLYNANVNPQELFSRLTDQKLSHEELLTDHVRFIKLIRKILDDNLEGSLHNDTRRALIRWVEDTDKDSSESIETYNETDINLCYDELCEHNGALELGETCINNLKKITGVRGVGMPASLNTFISSVNTFSQEVRMRKDLYEQFKDSFPKKDKDKLEEIWTKVEDLKTRLNNLTTTYQDKRREWEKWERKRAAAEANYTTVSGTAGVHRSERAQAQKTYEDALQDEPTVDQIQSFQEFTDLFKTWKERGFSAIPSPTNLPTLNQRLKRKLSTNFYKEFEPKYLKAMEARDQYHLLQNVPEKGTKVKIFYREVSGMTDLEFPEQAYPQPVDGRDFYIVSRTKKGVTLESTDNTLMVTLLGKSVDEGKPYKNMIIRNKIPGTATATYTNPDVGGAATHAIALNMHIT